MFFYDIKYIRLNLIKIITNFSKLDTCIVFKKKNF